MNRLKELRNERGLALKSVQSDTGITSSVLSYIENGRRPFTQNTLEILCKYFNVSTDYMLGKSDIRNPEQVKKEVVVMDSDGTITKMKYLMDATKDFTTEDMDKIFEYIDFLKQRKTNTKGSEKNEK